MEHGDNYAQNLMDNMQIASGGGGGAEFGGFVGVGDEISGIVGNTIGGKYEEQHDDEDELKYIKEVQQNEKQLKVDGFDGFSGEEAFAGVVGGGIGVFGNGNNDDVLLGMCENFIDDDTMPRCVNIGEATENFFNQVHGGHIMDEEEVEIIKNDGDFSTTSNTDNTTSTAEGEEDVDMLQVEMKTEEAAPQLEQQQENMPPQQQLQQQEEAEEEEPSSLATNTTNGTSSLSEMQQHPKHEEQQQLPELKQQLPSGEFEFVADGDVLAQSSPPAYNDSMENKENADPLTAESEEHAELAIGTHQPVSPGLADSPAIGVRPSELELERQHSQLNPDAKEFVPNFGSNPASPTSPFAPQIEGQAAGMYEQPPHPAVPHHLFTYDNDEFVAASPRKGRGCDMDTIPLPAENEFEDEVAKRPHELEQEDNLIGGQNGQEESDSQQVVADVANSAEDCLDFQRQSPASFIDHGPETCVDAESEVQAQSATDMMKEFIDMKQRAEGEDVTSGVGVEPPIEELLNTVQPLPIDSDSLNDSFVEEVPQLDRATFEKELFNVEEKEHVSHSPSTEELQMNLRNDMHSSAKDIMQMPIDMDNAAHMQESFYMEHTSADAQQEHQLQSEFQPDAARPNAIDVSSVLIDTSNPFDVNASLTEPADASFEAFQANVGAATAHEHPLEHESVAAAVPPQDLLFAFEAEKPAVDVTPSPISTEEKHLVEDTKEQIDKLEQQMDNLMLTQNDGNLSQIEEVAQNAITVTTHENPFISAQEAEEELDLTPQVDIQQPDLFQGEPEKKQQLEFQQYNDQLLPADPIAHELKWTPEPEPELAAEAELLQQQHEEIPLPRQSAEAKAELEINANPEAVASPVVTESVSEPEPIEASPVTPTADVLQETPEPAVEAVETGIVAAAAAGVAAVAAVAATAAVAAKKTDAAAAKKLAVATKGRVSPTKPKVGDVKKPAEVKKAASSSAAGRTTAGSTTAARPRTAPAKPAAAAGAAEKKTTTSALAAKPTTTARKPLSSSTTTRTTTTAAARPTTAATRTGATAPRPTTTARPATASGSTTARKPAVPTTTANGSAAARPRPITAPTKPTTLGLSTASAAPKPKLSPRSTLSSQLRKPAGPGTAAKSPTSRVTATTNGTLGHSRATTTTTTSRTARTTTGGTATTTTTTMTKTFTARPAPRSALSSTMPSSSSTTTRRVTVGVTPSARTTTTSSSSGLRKTASPSKPLPSAAGKLSPTKAASTLKPKTKEGITKTATPTKASSTIKPKQQHAASPKANGEAVQQELLQLNGGGEPQQQQNGTHALGELHENGHGAPAEVALIDA